MSRAKTRQLFSILKRLARFLFGCSPWRALFLESVLCGYPRAAGGRERRTRRGRHEARRGGRRGERRARGDRTGVAARATYVTHPHSTNRTCSQWGAPSPSPSPPAPSAVAAAAARGVAGDGLRPDIGARRPRRCGGKARAVAAERRRRNESARHMTMTRVGNIRSDLFSLWGDVWGDCVLSSSSSRVLLHNDDP